MLERIVCNSREDWLEQRNAHLGASEVAAAVGISPFKTPVRLWEEKTRRKKPSDISGNPAVLFGQKAEEHLRGLYLAEHPEFTGDYHPFDILYQRERPWMTCTLDCELINTTTNTKGILEIKTAETARKAQLEKWDGKVPDYYFAQLLHQQIVCGEEYKFSVLYAKLKLLNGNSSLREYEFTREDLAADREWLLTEAERFWWYVEHDTMPPVTLG